MTPINPFLFSVFFVSLPFVCRRVRGGWEKRELEGGRWAVAP